jgi:hypothetical protein
MQTETKHDTQTARPPLPTAAVFDEQHMAEARPVQPLGKRPSRKVAAAFQRAAARRSTLIAPIIAGVIICVGIGAASVDLAPNAPSAKDAPAQAASEALVPSTAIPRSIESAVTVRAPAQKRRTLSNPQARETLPPVEISEDGNDRKPRARLVSVMH